MDETDKIGACQWRYALVDGVKTDILNAKSGVPGVCLSCGAELRPRQGEQRGWHWYHKNGRKCDDWYEPKGAWHRWWQDNFRTEWQEKPISKVVDGEEKKHIADVQTDENIVIEFQYSHLSDASIKVREEFYGNMLWVVNGTRLEVDRKYGSLLANRERFNNEGSGLDWCVSAGDAVIHKIWGKSGKLVFWDFDGTFDEPNGAGYLYCVINGKAGDGSVIIVRVTKSTFLETGRNGQLEELVQRILARKKQHDDEVGKVIEGRRRVAIARDEIYKRSRQEEAKRKQEQNAQRLLEAWKEELENPAKFAVTCGWVEAMLIMRKREPSIELNECDLMSDAVRNELPDSGIMAIHLKKKYTKEEYERACSVARGRWIRIDLPKYEDLRKCAGCIVGKFEYAKEYAGDGSSILLKVKDIFALRNYDNKIKFVWYVADRENVTWPLTDELIKAVNDRRYRQTKHPRCPACDSRMKIIESGGKKFLGCTNYPKCKETFSLDEDCISCSESRRLFTRYLTDYGSFK